MRPHVPVPHVPVPPVPSPSSFPGSAPTGAIGAADATGAGRPPRRRRTVATVAVAGALCGVALMTGAATAAAAPAAPPVPATQPPVVPTAPPTSWASSQVVSTDELPISIPGVARKGSPPATTPRGVTTTAVLRLTASGPREAPPATDPVWLKIRQCESGNRYALNTGNGYYGAYQFAAGTWRKLGLPGLPHEAPPAVQDEAARLLYRKAGWGAWGGCARRLGLA